LGCRKDLIVVDEGIYRTKNNEDNTLRKRECVWKMKHDITATNITGVNVSKTGRRKQKYIVMLGRGRKAQIEEWPCLELAMKSYQTYKHNSREACKKANGQWLRVVAVRSKSENDNMKWADESRKTVAQMKITPYSKMYSSRLKKRRGF
jgi:hypothetical protein